MYPHPINMALLMAVLLMFADKYQVDIIYTDLKKSRNYKIFSNKLSKLGFAGDTLTTTRVLFM